MKKNILIILIGFFSFQSFAQDPDPDLFRTWYLYFVQSTDLGTPYEVSEIDPSIQPFITILENLDFSGEGACNTFNGNYEHQGTNDLVTINFNSTDSDCGFQVHNSFENSYFGFMQNYIWYNISQDSNGLTLSLGEPLMGSAIFKDYPLSTSDFKLNNIAIYPNPVSDQLYVSSENTVIETISIYSITGKKVSEEVGTTNPIDVSTLSNGMYFIVISSESEKTMRNFIKK